MGASLQQQFNGVWEPLGFFSRKLSDIRRKYMFNRELLVIYSASKYFEHMLEAYDLSILTDHKALTYAFFKKPEKAHSPILYQYLAPRRRSERSLRRIFWHRTDQVTA